MAKLVAVGLLAGGPMVYSSPDGVTWSPETPPAAHFFGSLVGGPPGFAGGTSRGTSSSNIHASIDDGVTWSTHSLVGRTISSAVYGGGKYVAVGSGASHALTPDAWTAVATTGLPGNNWGQICYGNGLYVCGGNPGSGSNRFAASADGFAWTGSAGTGLAGTWNAVAFGAGVFASARSGATGDHGTVRPTYGASSVDGVNWTTRSAFGGAWTRMAYGNGRFVAIGRRSSPATGIVMYSTDGTSWTYHGNAGIPTNVGQGNGDFEFVDALGLFVAVGGTDIMTSPDGINWTTTTFTGHDFRGVAWGGAVARRGYRGIGLVRGSRG